MRVIRACRELGIPSVAVYSEPDRDSLHVAMADEAIAIGPAAPTESYLNIPKLLEAARSSGADAIHPGYGFLSENADFAQAVADAGINWIGPPAKVIREMGSKVASRQLMDESGVPIVPGSLEGSNDPETVAAAAKDIKGDLFVKASAGGGGKGMRLVTDRANLKQSIREAIGEAKAAFGDDKVYVEKRIANPRHIEVQILADAHGDVVHLFERECSIQRRHQKLLEETPSTALDDATRLEIGAAAVAAAQAVGYENAGTVEFIYDDDGFYFLEMNTRIQVEHPITEMVTGIDLVQWQLRIARGEHLGFAQDGVTTRGHAIECRIYAEDSSQNFMPSCGVIGLLREPTGPGVRNDTGVYEGWEVSPYYDPILSKLVVHAEDRDAAIAKMQAALDEYVVHGVETSIAIHRRILSNPAFRRGDTFTSFLETHQQLLASEGAVVSDDVWVAAALYEMLSEPVVSDSGGGTIAGDETWRRIGGWEIAD